MDINKIEKNNNNFYYYKTDAFATINIKYYFSFEYTKENIIKAGLLGYYLTRINKKYKSAKEIKDRSKELYGTEVQYNLTLLAGKSYVEYELTLANPRIIKEDYFSDALAFYKDLLLEPYFENNNLDKDVFEQAKKVYINIEKNNIKDPKTMCFRLYMKNIVPDHYLNSFFVTDIIEYENIINNIKGDDIISFYNEILDNYSCSSALGNLLDEEIKQIENVFNFVSKPIKDYIPPKYTISNKDVEIVNLDTTQSNIIFSYEIKDYDYKNQHIYLTLLSILNSRLGPIFATYRTKMGIVYSAYADFINGLLYISANIDAKNKDKAIEGLDEIFKILHNREEMQIKLDSAKQRREQLYISYQEDFNKTQEELKKYILKQNNFNEEILNKIKNLTVEDIINQINNLEYKSTFFFKGGKNEE